MRTYSKVDAVGDPGILGKIHRRKLNVSQFVYLKIHRLSQNRTGMCLA